MLAKRSEIFSKVGKYSGLFMALLLLNLTALADDLSSLSFDNAPGYYAAQNNVRSGGMGEMIADNELTFSNSVPGHHEKTNCHIILKWGTNRAQTKLEINCPTLLQFNDHKYVVSGCPEYSLVFNNSPPVY